MEKRMISSIILHWSHWEADFTYLKKVGFFCHFFPIPCSLSPKINIRCKCWASWIFSEVQNKFQDIWLKLHFPMTFSGLECDLPIFHNFSRISGRVWTLPDWWWLAIHGVGISSLTSLNLHYIGGKADVRQWVRMSLQSLKGRVMARILLEHTTVRAIPFKNVGGDLICN